VIRFSVGVAGILAGTSATTTLMMVVANTGSAAQVYGQLGAVVVAMTLDVPSDAPKQPLGGRTTRIGPDQREGVATRVEVREPRLRAAVRSACRRGHGGT
jgi:hypothetical protein